MVFHCYIQGMLTLYDSKTRWGRGYHKICPRFSSMNPKNIRNPHRVKTAEPFHSVGCYRLKCYYLGKGIGRFVNHVSHNHQCGFPNPPLWKSSRDNRDMDMFVRRVNFWWIIIGRDYGLEHSDVCHLRTIT